MIKVNKLFPFHSSQVEHEKIKFISTSGHVIFCLLHKHTNDDIFEDFPKISDQLPKIFQNFSEGKTNVSEHFSDIFRRLPKISEKAPMHRIVGSIAIQRTVLQVVIKC